MNLVRINDFNIDDEETFHGMVKLFYESGAVHNEIDEINIKNTFTNCINGSPYIRGVFLCCDNQTCGYALLTFTYSNEFGGKIMEIDEIYIKPMFRNRGIASHFISQILEEYKNDIVNVSIIVKKDNEAAINLYKN